jgi:hypothetical protein
MLLQNILLVLPLLLAISHSAPFRSIRRPASQQEPSTNTLRRPSFESHSKDSLFIPAETSAEKLSSVAVMRSNSADSTLSDTQQVARISQGHGRFSRSVRIPRRAKTGKQRHAQIRKNKSSFFYHPGTKPGKDGRKKKG